MMSARLLTEAGRIARSQPVTSIVVSLICAGVVLGTLATTGRTVGAERAVLARIDDAGSRTIEIVDDRVDPELDVATLQSLIALSGVEWAIGLGSIEDVRPGGLAGAEPVPARTLNGTATELRLAGNGQAGTQVLVGSGSQRRLGLAAAAGTLRGSTGSDYAITGTFTATGPLASLEDSVLIAGRRAAPPYRRPGRHRRGRPGCCRGGDRPDRTIGAGSSKRRRVRRPRPSAGSHPRRTGRIRPDPRRAGPGRGPGLDCAGCVGRREQSSPRLRSPPGARGNQRSVGRSRCGPGIVVGDSRSSNRRHGGQRVGTDAVGKLAGLAVSAGSGRAHRLQCRDLGTCPGSPGSHPRPGLCVARTLSHKMPAATGLRSSSQSSTRAELPSLPCRSVWRRVAWTSR